MRSLFLNIKDKGNPGLRNEIVLGQVTPDKVVRMSKEEMASESVRLLNEKLAEKNLFKAKAVGVTQVSLRRESQAVPPHGRRTFERRMYRGPQIVVGSIFRRYV